MLEILSLGAGVQSSMMALAAAKGELTPMPDAAIFADTMSEPKAVYEWLGWLEKQLPFPVHRVHKGDLFADACEVRLSGKSGRTYMKGIIPAFVRKAEGRPGLLGRKCTADYKIVPIQRKVRELLGVKRGPKTVAVRMWIGISTDEASRMKPSRVGYIENCWPLIDAGISRSDCQRWMEANGFPPAPRSACVGCPFHSDHEWRKLKNDHPEDFARAVQQERDLQAAAGRQEALDGMPFLHKSCVPLGEVEFKKSPGFAQLNMFENECEGLCGV